MSKIRKIRMPAVTLEEKIDEISERLERMEDLFRAILISVEKLVADEPSE